MLIQDYYKVEQEFTTLEVGLRGFQIVASVSPSDVAAATTDRHLPKLLYAIGVYVVTLPYYPSAHKASRVILRVWDSITPSPTGATSSRPPQPVQELSKIKSLLELLALLLKIFEVAALDVLGGLPSLITVISSMKMSLLQSDLTMSAR